MKPLQLMTSTMLLATLLANTGFAADSGEKVYEPLPQSGAVDPVPVPAGTDPPPPANEVQSNVPQAQIDLRNKRLDARTRRDEMLKKRAALIEAHEQEQATEQQPQQ